MDRSQPAAPQIMDPRDPKPYLRRLEQRCAEAGLPMTVQRRAVMEALAERSDHPTADQIHSAVVGRLPDVSRATVYRSLETLAELGLLHRVAHPGSSVRFDANTAPHHHFLCQGCGGISDLPLESIDGHRALCFVGPPPSTDAEMAILVRGTCAACAED